MMNKRFLQVLMLVMLGFGLASVQAAAGDADALNAAKAAKKEDVKKLEGKIARNVKRGLLRAIDKADSIEALEELDIENKLSEAQKQKEAADEQNKVNASQKKLKAFQEKAKQLIDAAASEMLAGVAETMKKDIDALGTAKEVGEYQVAIKIDKAKKAKRDADKKVADDKIIEEAKTAITAAKDAGEITKAQAKSLTAAITANKTANDTALAKAKQDKINKDAVQALATAKAAAKQLVTVASAEIENAADLNTQIDAATTLQAVADLNIADAIETAKQAKIEKDAAEALATAKAAAKALVTAASAEIENAAELNTLIDNAANKAAVEALDIAGKIKEAKQNKINAEKKIAANALLKAQADARQLVENVVDTISEKRARKIYSLIDKAKSAEEVALLDISTKIEEAKKSKVASQELKNAQDEAKQLVTAAADSILPKTVQELNSAIERAASKKAVEELNVADKIKKAQKDKVKADAKSEFKSAQRRAAKLVNIAKHEISVEAFDRMNQEIKSASSKKAIDALDIAGQIIIAKKAKQDDDVAKVAQVLQNAKNAAKAKVVGDMLDGEADRIKGEIDALTTEQAVNDYNVEAQVAAAVKAKQDADAHQRAEEEAKDEVKAAIKEEIAKLPKDKQKEFQDKFTDGMNKTDLNALLVEVKKAVAQNTKKQATKEQKDALEKILKEIKEALAKAEGKDRNDAIEAIKHADVETVEKQLGELDFGINVSEAQAEIKKYTDAYAILHPENPGSSKLKIGAGVVTVAAVGFGGYRFYNALLEARKMQRKDEKLRKQNVVKLACELEYNAFSQFMDDCKEAVLSLFASVEKVDVKVDAMHEVAAAA